MWRQIPAMCAVLVVSCAVCEGQSNMQAVRPADGWQPNNGANGFAIEGGVVHVWQRTAGETDHPSNGSIRVPLGPNAVGCDLQFSVRFGMLRSIGANVEVFSGDTRALFIGADGVYGQMGADLAGKRVWSRPGDTSWHTVRLLAVPGVLHVSIDGERVGSAVGAWLPSRIVFGGKAAGAGRQTEAWLQLTGLTPYIGTRPMISHPNPARVPRNGSFSTDSGCTCPECRDNVTRRVDGGCACCNCPSLGWKRDDGGWETPDGIIYYKVYGPPDTQNNGYLRTGQQGRAYGSKRTQPPAKKPNSGGYR